MGEKIVIIGGGISGLTAAAELTRRGYAVVLLERHQILGGLARSIRLNDRPIEVYYHFICGGDQHLIQLVEELGLAEKLHWHPARTSYFLQGRLWPFTTPWDLLGFSPLTFWDRLRFGQHALRCRRMTNWQPIEHLTAEQWLVESVGRDAFEVIWRPLLEVKFGHHYQEVSAPWIWHRLHRYAQSRHSVLRPEELGYLDGGSQALLAALEERILADGGLIRTGCQAQGLDVSSSGAVVGLKADDQHYPADVVVAAIPLPELVRLLPAELEYRQRLAQVDFTAVACVLLALRRSVTDSFWVNVNDDDVVFNGFVEYSNLNPWRAYGGSEVLYIPFYFSPTGEQAQWSDQQFIEAAVQGLQVVQPDLNEDWVQTAVVSRDRYGQAICPPGFSQRRPAPPAPIPGLFVLDSTQLYPADRNLSGMIGLARRVARMVTDGQ